MSTIYSTAPGTVFRYTEPMPPRLKIVVGGAGDPVRLQNALVAVTSFGYSPQANAAITQSLDRTVHVYTFGERPGDVQVSGVIFSGDCSDGTVSGLENMMRYYRNNVVSFRGKPLDIVIGDTEILSVILLAARFEMADPQNVLGAFSLQFKNFPDNGGPQ